MEEIWKEYKRYRGKGVGHLCTNVKISNYGNVKGNLWGDKILDKNNMIVLDRNGKRTINSKGSRGSIYHLVYELFVGPIPKGYVIHHIDGNPLNDRLDNLQLLTKAEHKRIHMTDLLTEDTRKKYSDRMKGKNNTMYGKHPCQNTKWFNNGIISVRKKECPIGFVPGRIKNNKNK